MGIEAIYIEISSICNAKCFFCTTGYKTHSPSGFLSVKDFEIIISKVESLKKPVNLYNWGEPFLHQQFNDIVSVLNKYKVQYSLSSNAGVIPKNLDEGVFSGLNNIIFSMPGFSQQSYDKIHQLNFNKVLKNIEIFMNEGRKSSDFNALINYHIYKFNECEISLAKKFAEDIGVSFVPSYAFINDFTQAKKYIVGSLSGRYLERVSNEIYTEYIDAAVCNSPGNYQCPQESYLTINHKGQLMICCGVPYENEKYVVGNVLNESLPDLIEKHRKKMVDSVCDDCKEIGLAYQVHNPKYYNVNSNCRK